MKCSYFPHLTSASLLTHLLRGPCTRAKEIPLYSRGIPPSSHSVSRAFRVEPPFLYCRQETGTTWKRKMRQEWPLDILLVSCGVSDRRRLRCMPTYWRQMDPNAVELGSLQVGVYNLHTDTTGGRWPPFCLVRNAKRRLSEFSQQVHKRVQRARESGLILAQSFPESQHSPHVVIMTNPPDEEPVSPSIFISVICHTHNVG